ncbi:hypothetical protein BOTBODRAFT_55910 [Botryobasidium botryosum FD-172 SS1]|uniref:Uncharacterized protein n=1 Tax=Botryobasidium botryosum (strain FD-172 SS1) TaxID=930990 RepID=A0A067MD22_BOTB1|nr:hypothetical protein BOTBODRAFT_55910 [Botryobasidium botryosum FD-172 SS1]
MDVLAASGHLDCDEKEKVESVAVEGGNLELEYSENGASSASKLGRFKKWFLTWELESLGIEPTLPSQRSDVHFFTTFLLWLTFDCNILSISAGTLGPLVFGLGLRDSVLVIIGFNILGSALPAYIATFGAKLGLRQMCQTRFSFGYYGATLPAFLNLIGLAGYLSLDCIVAAQTISSASGDFGAEKDLISRNVGIVIIALISLIASFFGYKILSVYERYSWIPIIIISFIALSVNAGHLQPSTTFPPATASQIFTFGASIGGFLISYVTGCSDFTTHMKTDVSSRKLFTTVFLGLFVSTTFLEIIGAVFAAALPSHPTWQAGYGDGNLAGLLHAILLPAGQRFTRFLLVMLAISVTGDMAPSMYSFAFSFQTFIPFDFIVRIPRYFFSVLVTGIIIPLSIVAARRFYTALSNFLGLIGYSSAIVGAILFTEHIVSRRATFANYNVSFWNQPRRLSLGMAAIAACVVGADMVVLCMQQAWFVGPVARKTRDIAFLVSFFATGLVYVPFRWAEKRWLRDDR